MVYEPIYHYREYVCENHVKSMWKTCENEEPREKTLEISHVYYTTDSHACENFMKHVKNVFMHVNFFLNKWTLGNACETLFSHMWNNLVTHVNFSIHANFNTLHVKLFWNMWNNYVMHVNFPKDMKLTFHTDLRKSWSGS